MTEEKSTPPNKRRIPPWRWSWIGFAVAVILWFSSSAYFQKAQQMDDIEYQSGGIEEAGYETVTQRNMRNMLFCKIGAGILCLASFTYLISQADVHRPRSSSNRR